MKPNVLVIHPDDNVAVALVDIKAGDTVRLPDGNTFEAVTDVAFSHKLLLRDLPNGAEVIKYGEAIGRTSSALKQGEWVHAHNLDAMESA